MEGQPLEEMSPAQLCEKIPEIVFWMNKNILTLALSPDEALVSEGKAGRSVNNFFRITSQIQQS